MGTERSCSKLNKRGFHTLLVRNAQLQCMVLKTNYIVTKTGTLLDFFEITPCIYRVNINSQLSILQLSWEMCTHGCRQTRHAAIKTYKLFPRCSAFALYLIELFLMFQYLYVSPATVAHLLFAHFKTLILHNSTLHYTTPDNNTKLSRTHF